MRVLDYGGGNDVLCHTLRANGFKEAVTYDPMVPEHALKPAGKLDLVTCFETLEHLPDPGHLSLLLACLLIIAFVPDISTFLPKLMGY